MSIDNLLWSKNPSFIEKYYSICDYLNYKGIWFEPVYKLMRVDRFEPYSWLYHRDDCYIIYLKEFHTHILQDLLDKFKLDYMIYPRDGKLMVVFYNRPDKNDTERTVKENEQKYKAQIQTDSNRTKNAKTETFQLFKGCKV